MRSIYLFIILTLVILVSCTVEETLVPDLTQQIEDVRIELKQAMLNHGIPGGVIAVFDGDEEIIISEGYANIDDLTAISADMKFRIASNTKTLTARRILMLAEEGELNLEDNLTDYLPDCGILYADVITIKQLLNHTSGIANYNGQEAFGDIWFTNPLYEWSVVEILDLIRNATPDFYPGTPDAWNYSDSNYFLLGLIIEEITNNSAEDEISLNVISLVGLENTSFPVNSEMPDGYCTGYRFDAEQNSLVDASNISPTAPWTGGAIISDIRDLGKWVRELGSGSLLTPEMREQCFTFMPVSPGSQLGYGLGVMEIFGTLRGHTGMIQGYESCMLYCPESDVSIIVFVNRCNEDQGIQPATSLCVHAFQTLYPEMF